MVALDKKMNRAVESDENANAITDDMKIRARKVLVSLYKDFYELDATKEDKEKDYQLAMELLAEIMALGPEESIHRRNTSFTREELLIGGDRLHMTRFGMLFFVHERQLSMKKMEEVRLKNERKAQEDASNALSVEKLKCILDISRVMATRSKI